MLPIVTMPPSHSDEGQDVDVPQRDHTGIIVRFRHAGLSVPRRTPSRACPRQTSPTAPPVAPVAWLEWSPAAFARARDEGKPVLLSISANWCHGCAVMDRVAYGRSRGGGPSIARGFVPMRVDADRRPDVNDRYNLDGWPTTALLTPSGEILTGTTYLPADGLHAMLAEVADAYAHRARRARRPRDRGRLARAARSRARAPAGIEPDLVARRRGSRSQVVDECDPDHGGFGADGKFLHVAGAARRARGVRADATTPRSRDALTRTLDGMAGGAIHDEVDGGFFRYAAGRDWTRPHTEKMLDDQAGVAVAVSRRGAASSTHDALARRATTR